MISGGVYFRELRAFRILHEHRQFIYKVIIYKLSAKNYLDMIKNSPKTATNFCSLDLKLYFFALDCFIVVRLQEDSGKFVKYLW